MKSLACVLLLTLAGCGVILRPDGAQFSWCRFVRFGCPPVAKSAMPCGFSCPPGTYVMCQNRCITPRHLDDPCTGPWPLASTASSAPLSISCDAANLGVCAQGLTCRRVGSSPYIAPRFVCQEGTEVNGPCGDGRAPCSSGQFCSPNFHPLPWHDFQLGPDGTCRDWRKAGEGCGWGLGGGVCEPGLECLDGKCRRRCETGNDCPCDQCCDPSGLCSDSPVCAGCHDDAQGTHAVDPANRSGAYGADTLDPQHWTNAAGEVASRANWGAATNYFIPTAAEPVLRSIGVSRDMEVETWFRNGTVVLRHTGGRGIFFDVNLEVPGGQAAIGILDGATRKYHVQHVLIAPRVSGYRDLPTDGDRLTFGVSGFDMYAKWNGQEFIRLQDYRHMAPGTATIMTAAGYGVRHTEVRHLPRMCLHSDYAKRILDLRDFHDMRCTRAAGSIAKDSNQLILSSLPSEPFRPGDRIIVELDAGAVPGTVGVGGTWPKQAYDTAAAMQADTTRPDGTYAWLRADGRVHQWWQKAWHRTSTGDYYIHKALPLALRATVTSVSADGHTLTLDRSAAVKADAADVHFDNGPLLNRLMRQPSEGGGEYDMTAFTPANVELRIPSGECAVGELVTMFSHPGWKVVGAGVGKTKLFSPRGVPSFQLAVIESANALVTQLDIRGNARDAGFGLNVTETEVAQGEAYPVGILVAPGGNGSSNGTRVADVTVTDAFQAFVSSYSDDVVVERVRAVMTQGLRDYLAWTFQWKDSVGGGCTDCTVESAKLLGGFESFKSRGTVFRRCKGTNATMAMNSAGDYLVDGCMLVVKAGGRDGNEWFSLHEPMVNINTAAESGAQYQQYGGTLRNVELVQEGYLSVTGPNHDTLKGININAANPHVVVEGGSFTAPGFVSPAALCGFGLNSTGDDTVVDGLRDTTPHADHACYGGYESINVIDGVIRNCVAYSIRYKKGPAVLEPNNTAQIIDDTY